MSLSHWFDACVGFQWIAIGADLVVFWKRPRWEDTWNFCYLPIATIPTTVMALISFALGLWWRGALMAAFAAIGVWIWWNNTKNRRRRKKMAERVAGRVVDLGGVLGVRPVEG